MSIHGNVKIGRGTLLCEPNDINGNQSEVRIGSKCDIAAFVSINCADSSKRCVGLSQEIERLPIRIGHHTFVGQGAIILGGTTIGHHCIIGAGVVLKRVSVPPWTIVRRRELPSMISMKEIFVGDTE